MAMYAQELRIEDSGHGLVLIRLTPGEARSEIVLEAQELSNLAKFFPHILRWLAERETSSSRVMMGVSAVKDFAVGRDPSSSSIFLELQDEAGVDIVFSLHLQAANDLANRLHEVVDDIERLRMASVH
jgi:hypothetical protein